MHVSWIKFFPVLIASLLIILAPSLKADDNDLARDEVAAIKKKVVAALAALGALPEGYARTSENFDLPTSANFSDGKFYPIQSGVRQQFGSKAAHDYEANKKKKEEDFQKKYAEAMAKNDYETMGKLGMEMSQNAGQDMANAMAGPKEPLSLQIQFNSNPYDAIDPDNVVLEKPGVIALKKRNNPDDPLGKVSLYFDPITLKDTKKLSKVEIRGPQDGISNKLAVYNIAVIMEGKLDLLEAWSKRIDTKTILGLIDGSSK